MTRCRRAYPQSPYNPVRAKRRAAERLRAAAAGRKRRVAQQEAAAEVHDYIAAAQAVYKRARREQRYALLKAMSPQPLQRRSLLHQGSILQNAAPGHGGTGLSKLVVGCQGIKYALQMTASRECPSPSTA